MPLFKSRQDIELEVLAKEFDRIVAENHSLVYGLALRLVGSVADAEDITQEVFLKLYRSVSTFRNSCKISTLLYRITYNQSVDHLRKRKIPKCELREDITTNETTETLTYDEKMSMVERAIKQLTIEEQAIVTLFYMEDKSIEEISKIVSLSIANIKVKLHRTRKKLHDIIDQR